LMNIFEIRHTTNAMMTNAMIELMNAPHRMATSVAASPGLRTSLRELSRRRRGRSRPAA
jgi:hypothetical protein